MTKVVMVGTAEKSGGGITSVIKLMKKMPVWKKYSCYWLGTQIHSSSAQKLFYAISAALKSPFIMWKYDIIHFHMVPGITLLIQLPELIIARLYRKKIVMEVHVGNQLVPYARDKFFKWWLRQADFVLLLAKKWVNLYNESYSDVNTPADVLYNACEMHEPIPFEEKKKLIIFAGTIHENKAPDLLLKAWAKLKSRYPDWHLSFMGSGDIRLYEEMAEELGIRDSTEFTGYIGGEEKYRRFHDASILCMCSYVEGFPMVVLEAWAHSVSVITTPVGGLPDVIEEGKNCLTFPFGDYNNLSEQLETLIDNRELRKEMCEYGYSFAQSHFSLERISTDLDRIYSNLS